MARVKGRTRAWDGFGGGHEGKFPEPEVVYATA